MSPSMSLRQSALLASAHEMDDPLDGPIHEDLQEIFSPIALRFSKPSNQSPSVPAAAPSMNKLAQLEITSPFSAAGSTVAQAFDLSPLTELLRETTKRDKKVGGVRKASDIAKPSLFSFIEPSYVRGETLKTISSPPYKRRKPVVEEAIQACTGIALPQARQRMPSIVSLDDDAVFDLDDDDQVDELLSGDLLWDDSEGEDGAVEPSEKPSDAAIPAQPLLAVPVQVQSKQNPPSKQKYSNPLHWAIQQNAPSQVIKAMIETKPSALTAQDGPQRETPIAVLLRSDNTDKAELCDYMLLKSPMCATIVDRRENTPLHLAVACGNTSLETVERIIDLYPRALQFRNFHGKTPWELCKQLTVACSDDLAHVIYRESVTRFGRSSSSRC